MRIEGKLRVTDLRKIWSRVHADEEQGFDEFMNLVIDDAVEVTLANAKKETPEERRSIGAYQTSRDTNKSLTKRRPNPAQGRQHLPRPATSIDEYRRRVDEAPLRYPRRTTEADLGSDAMIGYFRKTEGHSSTSDGRAVERTVTHHQGVQAIIRRVHRDCFVWREKLLGQRETNLTWLVSPPRIQYQ
jgi:hypothetical protein